MAIEMCARVVDMRVIDLCAGIEQPNRERCRRLMTDNAQRIGEAWGSSHNHQAWPGGYMDHVTEVLAIADRLYPVMVGIRPLPFTLASAHLVLFLHDLEKPWKKSHALTTKESKRALRDETIRQYGIELTPEEQNALRYVEGEGSDYRGDRRIMNELAAFCHMCDVASARIWHAAPPRGSGSGASCAHCGVKVPLGCERCALCADERGP